ncbi:MAG: TerC family protein [Gemmataceae bacterium]
MGFEWIVPLLTLTLMEIVLGIDNVIFIAILVGKLPREQQARARTLGLGLALGTRLLLLFSISWVMQLTTGLFHWTDLGVPASWLGIPGSEAFEELNVVSWRDVILIVGGLFLIGKSTYEIHDKLEGSEEKPSISMAGRFGMVLVQIAILDIIFSLDSVITAVGMARDLWVMVVAMVIAVGVMLFFAGAIGDFVGRHPTLKILALSFLILIGVMLVSEGVGKHIERGYIYFAMSFSLVVELINLKLRKPSPAPVTLKEPRPFTEASGSV